MNVYVCLCVYVMTIREKEAMNLRVWENMKKDGGWNGKGECNHNLT